jgi:DNA-directed RNA polymerase specialized sigma24 family protein
VLLLVSVEDMSYADTARVLQLPLGTVMSRLSRARSRLRELMEAPPAASPAQTAAPQAAAPSLRRLK